MSGIWSPFLFRFFDESDQVIGVLGGRIEIRTRYGRVQPRDFCGSHAGSAVPGRYPPDA